MEIFETLVRVNQCKPVFTRIRISGKAHSAVASISFFYTKDHNSTSDNRQRTRTRSQLAVCLSGDEYGASNIVSFNSFLCVF